MVAVSQPDRRRGRGRKLQPTPVRELAEQAGIPCVQPTKLRDGWLATRLAELRVDLAIVVAYGRILPKDVFQAPPHGAWNVHASVLPRHRGAAPIQHAILSGDEETGVTLMMLSEGMDEGDMLLIRTLRIDPAETSGELFLRLADLGAQTLITGLSLAKTSGLPRQPQDPTLATYAPMLEKSDGALDFRRPAVELDRLVRGLHPWPGAFVATSSGPLKIHRAAVRAFDKPDVSVEPGTVASIEPELLVGTGSDALALLEVQPPGRSRMAAADYLRGVGRTLAVGARLNDG